MTTSVRRRLAAGGGLLSAALVAGVVSTLPASAVVTAPEPAYNDRSQSVTFTTENMVPPGSFLRFRRVGGTEAEAFTVPVTGNDSSLRRPTVTLDLRNPQENQVTMTPGAGPANPGTYTVTVVSFGNEGETCPSGCLRVLSPTKPAISKVEPTGTPRGTAPQVTLTGLAFARGTKITVVNTDLSELAAEKAITVTEPTDGGPYATNTTLRRIFTVSAGADLGPKTLLLENTDGEKAVCPSCFNVLGANITSISPTEARNTPDATAVPITFTAPAGTFAADASATLVYVGATTGSSTQQLLSIPGTVTSRGGTGTAQGDGSTLTATFDLAGKAPGVQAYLPTVTSANGTNQGPRFTLSQPDAPTVTGAAPNKQQVGTASQVVNVSGTGFAKGATVTLVGQGMPPVTAAPDPIPGTDVVVTSPTSLSVRFVVPADASTAEKRDIVVQNTDAARNSANEAYELTPAPSPSPSVSATTSPSASPSASPSRSATPTVSATPSRSATPTATASPTRSPSASLAPVKPTVALDRSTITSQESAVVSGTARPGAVVQLLAYSRPNTAFRVVRETPVSSSGQVSFTVTPSGNTRLFLRQRDVSGANQVDSNQLVLTVRTSINLKVTRTGTRTYRFTGSTLPKRPGQLVTVFYQAAGGKRVIASRARVADNGTYNVTRRFSGGGTFTLFTATGTDINNAGNESNRVRTTIR